MSAMEINLLVLDVGNTRLSLGVFSGGALVYSTRIAHEHRADWDGRIRDAWSRIAGTENSGIAGATVNPSVLEPLEHAVQQTTNQKIEWVGRDLDIPIKVATENPEETGIDRVLKIAAAFEQMGKSCAVVDAGTAITVDRCNDAGEFLGGSISPG